MIVTTDTFNEILTNFAQGAYRNPGTELDLNKLLFPAVQVDELEGQYDKWGIAEHFTAVDTTLARHNTAHRIEISRTKGYFNCDPAALEIAHWKPTLLQKSGARFREESLKALMDAQFTSRQVSAVDILRRGISADPELGDLSDSPIEMIDALFDRVVKGTFGRKPTHLLMGRTAWNTIRNHEKVLSRTHALAYAMFEDAFMSTLSYQGVKLVIADSYAIIDDKLTELLENDVVALYNEETPSLSDLSMGKEFTLSPAGPEVHTYQEKGIYDVDMLLWSSDRQITNSAAAARMELKNA